MNSTDLHDVLEQAVFSGVVAGVKDKLAAYNSPLDCIMERSLVANQAAIEKLLSDAVLACVGDTTFRAEIAIAVRERLAKTLVQRFGGELEKRVNELKSNPATRARITLAIDDIVKSSS